MMVKNNRPINYKLNYKVGGHTNIVVIQGSSTIDLKELLSVDDVLNKNDIKRGVINVFEEKKENVFIEYKKTEKTILVKAQEEVEKYIDTFTEKKKNKKK